MLLHKFVKEKRNNARLKQSELAEKAGLGLRFVRDLEQGKETLRLDKVNQLLQLFGHELGPVELKRGDVQEIAHAKDESNSRLTRKKR